MNTTNGVASPREIVAERLNDPKVAASLLSLLDNAELLSTLVTGLDGLVGRGDTIIESIAGGVREAQTARAAALDEHKVAQTIADAKALAANLRESMPVVNELLKSDLFKPDVVGVLSVVADSVSEGAATAKAKRTSVSGVLGALKALKDPDVARGLGMLLEIAKALGQRVDTIGTATPTAGGK
jgi:uncharacterized protein YjgD (DUF1641 family)